MNHPHSVSPPRIQPGRLLSAPLALFAALLTVPAPGLLRAEVAATPATVAPADAVITPEIARQFYAAHPDRFRFKTAADLPADLTWLGDESAPEFASAEAKRGGVLTISQPAYPPTLRPIGPNSNHSMRSFLYDSNEFSLVMFHPDSRAHIPGLALKWAISEDKRTVWFKLDPSVKFNDGQPVTADDYLFTMFLGMCEHTQEGFYKDYYEQEFESITKYDDHTLAVTLPRAKPDPLYFATLPPTPRRFYAEYGSDFVTRYQRRHQPTTGPYRVLPGDDVSERSITLTRNADWWGDSRRYFRHRFNPDKMVLTVVRDQEKSMRVFYAGETDLTLLVSTPKNWYGAPSELPVRNGWVERDTFFNDLPRAPSGFYLNCAKAPLDNLDVRLGLHHTFDMQRVIHAFFRGDYDRLNQFSQGYREFSAPDIHARPYDPDAAMRYFARAGFDKRGPDGILRDRAGRRLSFRVLIDSDGDRKKFLPILVDSAKKAGVELTVEALERTTMFKKVKNKGHEIVYWNWATSGFWPEYRQHFHSENAVTSDGSPKPDTNNITSLADPTMDNLIDRFRELTDKDEMIRLSHLMQHRLHDRAVFVPGPCVPHYRVARWRWVRFPEKFDCRSAADPFDYMLFWIDEDLKKETAAARAAGKSFGRHTNVHDTYRTE